MDKSIIRVCGANNYTRLPFDFGTPKAIFEKTTKAVDWIVEEIIRQKNWRSLLILIDVALFLAFNPHEWPFEGLLPSFFSQLKLFGWYRGDQNGGAERY